MNNYKNCIAYVLDASSSMSGLKKNVIELFNSQIANLTSRSKELDQETRTTVYTFADDVKPIVFDTDVLRTPKIEKFYEPYGNTALIDATIRAITDLQKVPQICGDYAYLIYVISDGDNNRNAHRAPELEKLIKTLPDNFTIAFLAPHQSAVHEAKQYGFPASNIQVWDISSRGMEEASKLISDSTSSFMKSRSSGVRSTKTLFNLNTAKLSSTVVKKKLKVLNADDYELYSVHKEAVIKPFVESWTKKTYRPGSAFYMLTKPEKVQAYKQVCLQEKVSGKVYSGQNARDILGLPDQEVKVSAADHDQYDIFLQSSSLNRKLVAGTKLLVIK